MKILHLPNPVSGNAYGLSKAERSIGLDSKTFYTSKNPFQVPGDFSISDDKLIIKFIKIFIFILFRINQYDVLHFNMGSTLVNYPKLKFNNLDLFLYKKKTVFVTYNGDDARQQYNQPIGWEIVSSEDKLLLLKNRRTTDLIESRIFKFSKIVQHNFALNPDLIKHLPPNTTFLPYTISNWDEIKYYPPNFNSSKVLIIHAPTSRVIKGSNIILPILEELKSKFPGQIDYILVEGLTIEQAMKEYVKADLVIDQLIVGWYGAFAVEAMKMGKPVMVYIHLDDLVHIPKDMAIDLLNSVINVNLLNLQNKIIEIIKDKTLLRHYSDNGLNYVNKWHNPKYVAQIVKEHYEVLSR